MASAAIGKEVVSDVLENNRAGQIALAANQIRLADFSRDQELQADAVGIRMIGRAGFDPFAAARFLETMNKFQLLQRSISKQFGDGSFLSSHPTTPHRVSLAKRHARFFGAPGVGERQRDRYLAGIDGILYGDSADAGYIRGQSFFHGGLGITFKAPAGFSIVNQPKAVTISGPGDMATRFDATVLSEGTGLSGYMKSGWVNGLVSETVREQTINGMQAATALAVADGWRFRIHLVRNGEQIYRFITAAPQSNTQISAITQRITGSFRILSEQEQADLSPLRIRIVSAEPGQAVGDMTARMGGITHRLRLFRILNSLPPGTKVQPGEKYKIVSDRP